MSGWTKNAAGFTHTFLRQTHAWAPWQNLGAERQHLMMSVSCASSRASFSWRNPVMGLSSFVTPPLKTTPPKDGAIVVHGSQSWPTSFSADRSIEIFAPNAKHRIASFQLWIGVT